MTFPQQARGESIPLALGSKLSLVSAWYGRTDADIKALCKKDRSITMDRRGRLQHICAGPAAAATAPQGTVPAELYPASETFLLHSLPGASKVIYLDFDGHVTTGTEWNSAVTNGNAITTPAYDIDGVPSTFSSTELSNIQTIWRIVAEDFGPFDVDVTTQDPGIEALRKTSSTDQFFGIRACIGGSSSDWLGMSAGGVAYLDSFSWNSGAPAFVFPAQLSKGNPKYTGDATSHEVGHSFGLSHDGQNPSTEYYAGHSNWAPIMGAGYSRTVVQWSRGEYSSANNLENDIAIISSVCPLRADLHGGDITTASAIDLTVPSIAGLIESSTDVDVFRFVAGSGNVSFTVAPATVSPNLDVVLSLYDGVGNLVTSASPTTMGATLATSLIQGTYYLAVDGGGTGSPTTAYNDYGSLGQYFLSAGAVVAAQNQAPVAVTTNSKPLSGVAPLAVTFSSVGSTDSDGTIASYDWDFGNGVRSTVANPAYTYTTPGTYTASLVVIDNSGLASPASRVTVQVQNGKQIYVANLTVTTAKTTKGYQATATVTIKDASGALRSNAKIAGSWSGRTTGNVSGTTNTSGVAKFTSALSSTAGTFTFTISGVTLTGFTYAPTLNVKTTTSATAL